MSMGFRLQVVIYLLITIDVTYEDLGVESNYVRVR